ncbi:hypothetical protein EVA_14946 [gut metagenome]|uniref:Uncharacterized protein n=1 Tax=gut metagenome TaxID=749906 RepID=J9FPR5_9ZZZZ
MHLPLRTLAFWHKSSNKDGIVRSLNKDERFLVCIGCSLDESLHGHLVHWLNFSYALFLYNPHHIPIRYSFQSLRQINRINALSRYAYKVIKPVIVPPKSTPS